MITKGGRCSEPGAQRRRRRCSGRRFEPENPYSNNNLALVLFQLRKNLDEAQEACERAVRRQQTYAAAYELAAAIMCTRGVLPARAEQYARRSIDLDPEHCPGYRTLATALVMRGAAEEATEALEEDKDLRTNGCADDVGIRNELAWRYIQSRRFDDAIRVANEASRRGGAQRRRQIAEVGVEVLERRHSGRGSPGP